MKAQKLVIMMIGLPGSGKSTEAKRLADEYVDAGRVVEICSTDAFFTGADGVYRFNRGMLAGNHAQNFAR